MNFATFYAYGGLFMHVVSLCSVGALVALLFFVKEVRVDPNRRRGLHLARALGRAALMAGALGTLFGFMEVAGALQSVEALEEWPRAIARGGSISLITLTFGVMCTLPIGVVVALADFRNPPSPQPGSLPGPLSGKGRVEAEAPARGLGSSAMQPGPIM